MQQDTPSSPSSNTRAALSSPHKLLYNAPPSKEGKKPPACNDRRPAALLRCRLQSSIILRLPAHTTAAQGAGLLLQQVTRQPAANHSPRTAQECGRTGGSYLGGRRNGLACFPPRVKGSVTTGYLPVLHVSQRVRSASRAQHNAVGGGGLGGRVYSPWNSCLSRV